MSPLPDGIIRTPDGVFVLRDDTHLSRHIERWFRLDIEYQFLHELAPYVPEGGVVIDAGACLGDHALTWSQMVGATGKVFCFEPHPLTFQALRLNMDRLVNVACLNCALGDRNAELPFQRDPNIGASYMAAVGTEKVWVDTLDNLLEIERLTRLDFIHLDAEGYETFILRGAREVIRRFRPAMMLEYCPAHMARAGLLSEDLKAELDGLGYAIHALPGQDHPQQRDILCLPK